MDTMENRDREDAQAREDRRRAGRSDAEIQAEIDIAAGRQRAKRAAHAARAHRHGWLA
jgi:hypothetical protein